jgi:hypothetical protein
LCTKISQKSQGNRERETHFCKYKKVKQQETPVTAMHQDSSSTLLRIVAPNRMLHMIFDSPANKSLSGGDAKKQR